jgi:hypothetical protein
MKSITKTLLLSAFLATTSLPALAEDCADTSWSALAATDCAGSFVGNINGSPSEVAFLDSEWGALTGGSFDYLGKSDDASNGPFTGNPDDATDGTLTFDQAISGWFVIGLKAAGNYSYYLFNAVSPISSLTYDSTAGVALNRNGVPQELSHAALYAVAQPVPEPETYALMMAGLAAVGFLSRRRKSGSRQ